MTEKDNSDLGDDQLKKDLAAEAEGADDDTKKKVEEEAEETDDVEDQDEEGDESEDEGAKGFEDTDTPQIPVRNASYIIQRQKKTIEKLRSKKSDEQEEESDDDVDEEEDDEEPAKDIASEVARQLKPVTEKMAQEAEESELADLFKGDPDAKGYERAIRAFMKHPAWAQVPPAAIYHHLAYEHAQQKGANQKKVADVEAEQTRGTGSQRRITKVKKTGSFPTADEIDSMSDEQLDELAHKVQTGQFAKK